jgi:hypothetical protein
MVSVHKLKTKELFPGRALKCRIQIHFKRIRIRNTDLNLSKEEWGHLCSGEAIQNAEEILTHQFPQVSHLDPPVVQVAPRHFIQQLDISLQSVINSTVYTKANQLKFDGKIGR